MSAIETFSKKAPAIMNLLMADFGLTDIQAAAILGNLGHESAGLTAFQEINPIGGGRGGYGWAQWTGPRRKEFEAYCARNHLDPKSDKANYGWLFTELSGPYASAITATKKANSIKAAVRAFENYYEKAGVKNYNSRETWARRAFTAYHTSDDVNETKRVQTRLAELGLGKILGKVDGIFGPATKEAVTAFQLCRGGLAPDGVPGPETKLALFPAGT